VIFVTIYKQVHNQTFREALIVSSIVMAKSSNVESPAAGKVIWRMFTSYEFRFCTTLVSAAFAFLPLLLFSKTATENLQGTVVAASLREGRLFYESAIVGISLVVPIAVDMFCDVMLVTVYNVKSRQLKSKKNQASTENLTIPEKILILIGFLMVPATAFLSYKRENLVLLFLCCRRCQLIIVFSVLFISWCRMFPKRFPSGRTSFSILCFCAGELALNFSFIYKLSQDPQHQRISVILNMLWIISLVRPYTLPSYPTPRVSIHHTHLLYAPSPSPLTSCRYRRSSSWARIACCG
jgi:hypothetical protein